MITAIGTDIVDIERMTKSLERWGERFQSRILNSSELRDLDNPRLASRYLARQFAAKEAVVKALGTGINKGVDFRDILVLRKKSGAPVVELLGAAQEHAASQGITRILVSISEEESFAIAFAVALGASQE